ncbi:hypothetical protein COV15_01165 [Candidatus Woesearchaeota archaeon CG10_big_fil_rev_8_21_14_0_10_34_12]|nr:MAG: hypothetical protein COV15_01165 [Candidatus Woesearchaeota archaeon CG10_big_fil_rev_8_21_14_0_10_34_12]
MKNKFFPALAVLVGTTIGAGFLGIPYVVSKAGFPIGFAYLVLVFAFMLLIKFYLGEVVLRTKGNHQLSGYAQIYLGKTGKYLMFFAMIFGIYSALIAYLIGEGQSLSYVFFGNLNYSLYFSLVFWIVMTVFTYIGLRALKRYELAAMIIVFSILALILVFFFGKINISNLGYVHIRNMFAPFGVILFSFLAFSAMPEVRRVLSGQEKLMKKTIFFGVFIPLLVYSLFSIIIVGVFGKNVPEISTLVLGRGFSILGVVTMFTAFFALSIAIRDMFRFDFKLGRFRGWLLCSFTPLILFLVIYFFKLVSFIQILSIAGVISGGLTGILTLLMNIRAKQLGKRNPEYSVGINWGIILVMSAVFILAVVLEFLF